MEIIDGKNVASNIKAELKEKILEIKNSLGIAPTLAVILVGDDKASEIYVSKKEQMADELGINSKIIKFSKSVSQEERQNKHKKLELVRSKNLKFITKPQSILTCESKIIGHAYDYDRNDISMLLAPLTTQEKISYLRRIKLILNYLIPKKLKLQLRMISLML